MGGRDACIFKTEIFLIRVEWREGSSWDGMANLIRQEQIWLSGESLCVFVCLCNQLVHINTDLQEQAHNKGCAQPKLESQGRATPLLLHCTLTAWSMCCHESGAGLMQAGALARLRQGWQLISRLCVGQVWPLTGLFWAGKRWEGEHSHGPGAATWQLCQIQTSIPGPLWTCQTCAC